MAPSDEQRDHIAQIIKQARGKPESCRDPRVNRVEVLPKIASPGAHLAVGPLVCRDIRCPNVGYDFERLPRIALVRNEHIRKLRMESAAAFLLTP